MFSAAGQPSGSQKYKYLPEQELSAHFSDFSGNRFWYFSRRYRRNINICQNRIYLRISAIPMAIGTAGTVFGIFPADIAESKYFPEPVLSAYFSDFRWLSELREPVL